MTRSGEPRRRDCGVEREARAAGKRVGPSAAGLPQGVLGNGRLWVVRRPLRMGRYATERLGRHGQRDGIGGRSALSATVAQPGSRTSAPGTTSAPAGGTGALGYRWNGAGIELCVAVFSQRHGGLCGGCPSAPRRNLCAAAVPYVGVRARPAGPLGRVRRRPSEHCRVAWSVLRKGSASSRGRAARRPR